MFEALFRIVVVVETDKQEQRVFPVTKNRPAVNETEFMSLLASVYQEEVYPTLRASRRADQRGGTNVSLSRGSAL
jgi:hypothetical protein